ncbi:hypothetical protein [uncultured Bartonella sp.]|uniref:hypothetical protein n=1 Tax=uncultured Bartonella sp. TaxID=104108 RepID=UPI002636C077|nr:hypothetical protein [uncultured Bartonella sp.]
MLFIRIIRAILSLTVALVVIIVVINHASSREVMARPQLPVDFFLLKADINLPKQIGSSGVANLSNSCQIGRVKL